MRINNKASYILRKRGKAWQVDFGRINGKQVRCSFKSKTEADAWAKEKNAEIKHYGKIAFSLNEQQRLDAVQALGKLPEGHTLSGAIDFYIEHAPLTGAEITTNNLLDEYLKSKKSAERRPASIRTIQTRVGRFVKDNPEVMIHKISTKDLITWLDKHQYAGIDRKNHITYLRGFFNFAVKRGYIKRNPADALEKPSLDDKMPEIMKVDEFEKLIRVVEQNDLRMIPYFALCSFAGLRPSEARGLDWKNIDFNEKLITVSPKVAKKRRMRHIDISDNLLNWLLPYRQDSGVIYYSRKAFKAITKKANITWIQDILRHTYCSMHLAKHQDQNKTSLQMGHLYPDVLFNHYRNLVTKSEAIRYWQIMPTEGTKIISIASARK